MPPRCAACGRRRRRPHRAVRDGDRRRAAPGVIRLDARERRRDRRARSSRPRRQPPTPRRLPPPPPSGRAPTRTVPDTVFVAGSIARDRPVVAVDHPHRALARRDGARPVADGDRLHHGARPRLDAGDGARLLARDPERAGAGGHRRRVRAEGDRPPCAGARPSSIRSSVPSTPDATHSAPPAKATALGALPMSIR